MKFDKLANKILEDFNIYPQVQTAPSTGPDQGMTHGDINNTFPSTNSVVAFKLPKRKKRKAKKKSDSPKETQSTHQS